MGTRPNFVKAGPLLREFDVKGIGYRLIHTGQHYDTNMSGVFLEQATVDKNLGVGSGSHGEQTARALVALEKEFTKNPPKVVIVIGDVNSTLSGALAASKLNIPIIHIEAGYRSYDRTMPEEINRVVVDVLSQELYAPTQTAMDNLEKEGLAGTFVGSLTAESALKEQPSGKPDNYIFATVHRPENVDDPERFKDVITALAQVPFVILPVHPRTPEIWAENIMQIAPQPYAETLALIKGAERVVTDSGGIQEEACVLGVPCVTIRKNTERVDTVSCGANVLVAERGIDPIVAALNEERTRSWKVPDKWDTNVANRIVEDICQKYLS